jgi:hypothetical protein
MAKIEEEDLEIFDEVPQSVLVEYFRLQNRLDWLKQSIKTSLEKGATVERGDITAKLQKSMRRSPNWKTFLAEIVGDAKIAEITEATPATETVSLKVDIKKQAMIKKDDLT